MRLYRALSDGIVEFYDQASGRAVAAFDLGLQVRSIQRVYPLVDLYALVDAERQLHFVRSQHIVKFVGDQRQRPPPLIFHWDATV